MPLWGWAPPEKCSITLPEAGHCQAPGLGGRTLEGAAALGLDGVAPVAATLAGAAAVVAVADFGAGAGTAAAGRGGCAGGRVATVGARAALLLAPGAGDGSGIADTGADCGAGRATAATGGAELDGALPLTSRD